MSILKLLYKLNLRKEIKKIKKGFDMIAEESKQAPPEVLDSLRGAYNEEMLSNNLKAIHECMDTIKNNTNPSIALDRYEYGLIKAYDLKQLEEVGLYSGNPIAQEYIDWFMSNKNRHTNQALERVKQNDNIVVQEDYLHRKRTCFTKEEEEMSFQFLMEHKLILSSLKTEFNKVWFHGKEAEPIKDKIFHYELALDKLYKIREFCINSGRGGEVYYTMYWEELFNSKNPCFSQEEVILRKIEYFQNQKNKLDSLSWISDSIIRIIEQRGAIYQKDLYKLYPDLDRQDIKDVVNELAANKIITKHRKSNSYELRIEK